MKLTSDNYPYICPYVMKLYSKVHYKRCTRNDKYPLFYQSQKSAICQQAGILPDTAISPYIRRGPFFRDRPPRFKVQMDPIFSMGWMPYITRLPGKK